MAGVSLFLGHDFDRALRPLDDRLTEETTEAIQRLYADRSSPGLHDELLHRLNGGLEIRSARVTRAYRLIFARHESRIVALWVDNHDEAYDWADRHRTEIQRRFERTDLPRIAGGPVRVPRVSPEDPVPVPEPGLLDEMAARGFEHYFAALDKDQHFLVVFDTSKRKGLSFVTAGAGTGKTSIAIRRALHLAQQSEFDARLVLYLCYNRVLMQTVRSTIDALGPSGMARQIEVNLFHSWAGRYLQRRGESVSVDEDDQWLPKAVLSERQRLPKAVQGALPNDVVVQEIKYVLRPNQFDAIDRYLNLTRPESQGLSPLRRPQRQTIWDLYQRIRQRPDYRFGWDDLIERARTALAADANPPRYRAVIVDEGQDCSPVMARLAKTLVAGAEQRLMVLADPAQALYPGTFEWSRREFGPRGGQARVLLRPYRSTRQIHALAASLYANVSDVRGDVDEVRDRAQRIGPMPRLAKSSSEPCGREFVAGSIRTDLEQGRAAGQIAVLTGTNVRRIAMHAALSQAGVLSRIVDPTSPPDGRSVSVMTVNAAKGLDFASVYLLDPGLGFGSLDSRRARLYVALTRSSRDLWIVCCADASSPLLNDLDPACYEQVDPLAA